MTDVFSKEKRSKIMRKIKGKNTKPEMLVRSYLHRQGLRYRLHNNSLIGNPDITFPKYKTVLFINGCFWHQHGDPNCKRSALPKSNKTYWLPKLQKTIARDRKNYLELSELGWRVLVIWECEINSQNLKELTKIIKNQ